MKIRKNFNLNKLLFREITHNDIWSTFKKAIPQGFSSTCCISNGRQSVKQQGLYPAQTA